MVIPIVVAVAAATLVVTVVMLISLARQVRRVALTIASFRDDLEPLLREIRADAERAGERLAEVSERSQRLRPGR